MSEQFFLTVVNALAAQSKCVSRQVGAVIVKDGRIISTGYNGTVSGTKNCCEIFDDSFDAEAHHQWSIKNEIHAEQNAIAMAAKQGISIDGCTCYCSLQPCNTCLLLLIQSGIKEIVYDEIYERSKYHEDLLKTVEAKGIVIRRFDASLDK